MISVDSEYLANIENYKMLAGAIVKLAALDYVAFYGAGAKSAYKTIEKFFNGEQFMLYTDGNIDPQYLIRRLREKSKKRKRRE